MNNKENYKNAINQIHASDELKAKTLEKIENSNDNSELNSKRKTYPMLKFLSTCAAVFLICFIGLNSVNYEDNKVAINDKENEPEAEIQIDSELQLADSGLTRFTSMEELKTVLEAKEVYFGDMALEESESIDSVIMNDSTSSESKTANDLNRDFSTTNTQVENVDEADIIKTDGEYVYYISNNTLYIVKASNLEIVSKIETIKKDEVFYIFEMYLKDNKVVVLGNSYIIKDPVITNKTKDTIRSTVVGTNRINTVKAIVYDITNRETPERIREVELEGNYVNSRMIGDNLYFISRNHKYYYDGMKDEEILPIFNDSKIDEVQTVNYTDIIYFKDSEDTSFMMVGGFNINDDEEICVETFFGAGNLVYANENNLYLTKQTYRNDCKTTIYKFKLDGSNIKLIAQTEVDGYMNNQFSMDEHDGNLRVATTSYINEDWDTTNNLFILNEKLELIGKIENLATEEKIYSVRFIGDVGYMVTFKEIDPLFVIDLSDPTNPTIKGELKIPGYSSYLHPYDENHIIGIGYNTKDNGYGGITNSNMKMSMFDVSDLSNPKEIFNVDIGNYNAYSEITYNHKVLFYKKSENLIGFPITYREYGYKDDSNGFVIFKIDMENNQFEKYGEVLNEINYKTNVDRLIYIEDVVYTLSDTQIISYDLNTLEKLNEVELTSDNEDDSVIYYEDVIMY